MRSIKIPGTNEGISPEEYANRYGINGANGLIHEQETIQIKKENVRQNAASDLAKDLLENFENMSEGEQENAMKAFKKNFKEN